MKIKIIILVALLTALSYSQSFKVEKITGTVKAQVGTDEKWIDVKPGTTLNANTVLLTGNKSSVQLSGGDIKFTLKETSALNTSNLKKLSLDELLLALAMEDMMNAPKKKDNNKSKSTAVYGTKEGGKDLRVESDNLGTKKLNGAMQLSESGFKESAVVAAKETFRKYPETNAMPSYRIYFADILFDRKLYDEAYADFTSIKSLALNDKEKKDVDSKLEELSKKLTTK